MRLAVIIVNYRTPVLALDAIDSLDGQIDPTVDQVIVVDNDSRDGSAERIEAGICERGFERWAVVVRSGQNGGFSAGNNVGVRSVIAAYYLLLNSDTIVRPGAIAALLMQLREHPEVGIAGPRLEWPDGTPQVSCFRDHTPLGELLVAAKTRPVTSLFPAYEVPLPLSDAPLEAEWLSFACALIRREVFDAIGLLDEGYFMYFEDADFCRAARAAGFRIRCFPGARVVHLRGGTSDVKQRLSRRLRPPRYFYASRARYFRKGYGVLGPATANACWHIGRAVSFAREIVGHKAPHTCDRQWLDNWIDSFRLVSS